MSVEIEIILQRFQKDLYGYSYLYEKEVQCVHNAFLETLRSRDDFSPSVSLSQSLNLRPSASWWIIHTSHHVIRMSSVVCSGNHPLWRWVDVFSDNANYPTETNREMHDRRPYILFESLITDG